MFFKSHMLKWSYTGDNQLGGANMQLELGKRIRELRHRDGRTQEDLAEAIGMTSQAVSRWEANGGYPDMEMIPAIANYFGVSIDELFGYENVRSKKVSALAEKINEMNKQNNGVDVNINECIAAAREALIEFPGNEKLTLALASVLYKAGYVRYGEHHIDGGDGYLVYDIERHRMYTEWNEAIKLYEKLLETLPVGEMRQQATVELSQLYKNLGEHEKALRLAETAPASTASKPILRLNAFDGKDAVAARGEVLLDTIRCAADLIEGIVWTDHSLPPKDSAMLLQNAISIYDLVCTDGYYGRSFGYIACLQMLRSYYLWLANERDGAFSALDMALTLAKKSDSLQESGKEFFSSPLLRNVRTYADCAENRHFTEELPEVWPWWSVPQYDRVKAEMQADPRWAEWVKLTKE